MEQCLITISRASSIAGCAKTYGVEMDGVSVGKLKNGGTVRAYADAGPHTISFRYLGNTEKSISISVAPDCQEQRYDSHLDMWGKLVLTSDSNRIPNYELPPKRPRRKHPILLTVGILFCLLLVIGTIGSQGDDTIAMPPPTTEHPNELTEEEQAALELEGATAKFQGEDYISAIKICAEISAKYPSTAIATEMDAYLDTQYAIFPHFTAKDLMRDYDVNIVNADKEHTDVVMVVSGTVNEIGKTNGDSNLTVMLNSDTYFYGVQLNFKSSQTDAIAALTPGDSVTAIGKCTGKSGKQLLVLDGNNVMIENCYLID